MAVEIKDLSFSYRGAQNAVLRGLSLSARDGECVYVSGENGGGKSTLVAILSGLLPGFAGGEMSGKVSVGGANPACVMQNIDSQLLHETAAEEMAFYEKYSASAALPPSEAAGMLGVAHLLDRKSCSLSSGEKQRLVLACALQCSGGKLAVLDEPMSYLDTDGVQKLHAAVDSMKARGMTVLITGPRGEKFPAADSHYLLEGGILSPASSGADAEIAAASLPCKTGVVLVEAVGITAEGGMSGCLKPSSIKLHRGEIAGLLGPNGCGKTTLAKLLAGWHKPVTGSITLDGKTADCALLRKNARFLGPNPYTGLLYARAGDNLKHALKKDFDAERAAEMLGATEFLDRDVASLSFGQAQRVALLCALAARPKLLVLDEAASCLDPRGFEQFSSALGAFAGEGGAALAVSHLENHIARLCPRTIQMEEVAYAAC